jgi:hypothetical protein
MQSSLAANRPDKKETNDLNSIAFRGTLHECL